MTLVTELTARMKITQTGDNDFGGPSFNATIEKLKTLINGTAADQADIAWADERTIAASGSEDLDLAGVLADAFGATVDMAEVVAILIIADAGNTNDVVVGDASAPVPLFGGTNPTFSVPPGGFFFVAAPDASGLFTVGAGSTDDLKIANSSSGTGVTYQIAIIGRSA